MQTSTDVSFGASGHASDVSLNNKPRSQFLTECDKTTNPDTGTERKGSCAGRPGLGLSQWVWRKAGGETTQPEPGVVKKKNREMRKLGRARGFSRASVGRRGNVK